MAETDDSAKPIRCAICGGTEGEHKDRHHAFTEKEGDLISKADDAKRKQQGGLVPDGRIVRGTLASQMPPHPTQVDRLTETLLNKGILDRDDVLYIAMGIPRQIHTDQISTGSIHGLRDSSGYADPAKMMPPGEGKMSKVVDTELPTSGEPAL